MTIIGITIHHAITSDQTPKLPNNIPIPEKIPTIHKAATSFLFQNKGTLYPVTNILHLRTTIKLTGLRAMVKNLCDNANKVEAVYEAYTGLIRGEQAFNLSSDMTTDLSNDNISNKPFERYSQAHISKKIGQGFKIQFNPMIDMLHQSCLQATTHVDLLLNLFNQEQDSPRRKKRQAGVLGGISLLLGIYNSYEIHQLSSKVDQIEQAEKDIVTSVEQC